MYLNGNIIMYTLGDVVLEILWQKYSENLIILKNT